MDIFPPRCFHAQIKMCTESRLITNLLLQPADRFFGVLVLYIDQAIRISHPELNVSLFRGTVIIGWTRNSALIITQHNGQMGGEA